MFYSYARFVWPNTMWMSLFVLSALRLVAVANDLQQNFLHRTQKLFTIIRPLVRSFIHKFTQCNDHHRNLRNVYRFYGTEYHPQFHRIRFVCTTNVWGVFLSGPFQLNQSQNHRENKQNSIKKMKIKNCCILNSFAFIGFSHTHILLLLAVRSSHITLCFDFRWMCSCACMGMGMYACMRERFNGQVVLVCVRVWLCACMCITGYMVNFIVPY